jgi:hypothetical protein
MRGAWQALKPWSRVAHQQVSGRLAQPTAPGSGSWYLGLGIDSLLDGWHDWVGTEDTGPVGEFPDSSQTFNFQLLTFDDQSQIPTRSEPFNAPNDRSTPIFDRSMEST